MNWSQSMYEVIGVPYPRLSLVLVAAMGAIVFGGGWWLVGRQYAKDNPYPPTQVVSSPATESLLMPQQQRLLELLAGYQRQFAASKLIIGRQDGALHFDGTPGRGQGISIVEDLYGTLDTQNAVRFEELMESMPPEYVRLLPEARFDNPFVVTVTAAGMRRLNR